MPAAMAVLAPLLCLGLAGGGLWQWTADNRGTSRADLVNRVMAEPPDVVVLGNSIGERALDAQRLAAWLDETDPPREHRVTELTLDGSAPVIWYLVLKNVVYASGAAPDLVVVPSTLSHFSSTAVGKGAQQYLLYQMAERKEPVLEAISGAHQAGLSPWFDLGRARFAVRGALLGAARELAVGAIFDSPDDQGGGIRERGRMVSVPALRRVFDEPGAVDDALARRVVPIVELEEDLPTVPEERPPVESYVGALVDLAQQHGSRVVMVWLPLPAKRGASRTPGPPHRTPLAAYLQARGETWVDLSTLPMPPDSWFDGVHMTDEGSAAFTDALATELIGRGVVPLGRD